MNELIQRVFFPLDEQHYALPLMHALIHHRNIWRTWKWAGLAGALVTGVAAADGTSPGSFAVWAIGLPDGYVVMEYQPIVIHVTADDVMRRVVQVRDGSRLVITADSPTGYAVDFIARGKLFQSVTITGIGSAVELGPAGGTVVQREAAAGRRVLALDYQFILAPDARPGTYAWPLELAVREVATRDP